MMITSWGLSLLRMLEVFLGKEKAPDAAQHRGRCVKK